MARLRSGEYEMPEGPFILINMQEDPFQDLNGNHVHLCPNCFDYAECDMVCTWDGESLAQGLPACHPTLCDRCRAVAEQMQDQGSGI